MAIIYFNGIPVNDGYAYYIDRYFPPRKAQRDDRDSEYDEYEDLTDNENEQID